MSDSDFAAAAAGEDGEVFKAMLEGALDRALPMAGDYVMVPTESLRECFTIAWVEWLKGSSDEDEERAAPEWMRDIEERLPPIAASPTGGECKSAILSLKEGKG